MLHWPTDHPGQDNIISLFGPREWRGRPGFHYGVDFGAEVSDRFLAVEEATLAEHFWGGNIGWVTKYLSVDGKRMWETHGGVEALPQPLFTHVDAGGCVDWSGDSESRDVSTGPHLHLGLWDMERGEYVDPLPFIMGGMMALTEEQQTFVFENVKNILAIGGPPGSNSFGKFMEGLYNTTENNAAAIKKLVEAGGAVIDYDKLAAAITPKLVPLVINELEKRLNNG